MKNPWFSIQALAAETADAGEVPETSLFTEIDFAMTAVVIAVMLAITTLYFLQRYLRSRFRSKELKQKVIDLQNELLTTQKNLEELTKERNRKFD